MTLFSLEKLPSQLLHSQKIRSLDLSKNKLSHFPSSWGNLATSLKSLNFDENKIQSIPDSIATLEVHREKTKQNKYLQLF